MNVGVLLVSWAIDAFAGYRAFDMSRAFVNPIYRRRAVWMVVLAFLAVLVGIVSLSTVMTTPVGGFLAFIVLLLLAISILRVVDIGISIATESDFFHRDVVRWRSVRLPAYVAPFVGMVALFYAVSASRAGNGPYIWIVAGFLTFVIVFAAVYGYAAVALVIGSRRTADRVLRAFVKFLGLMIGSFALGACLSILVQGPASSFSVPAVPGNLASVLTAYLYYRAVMSLSTVGRVEKVPDAPLVSPATVEGSASR